jgi:hypothetical protein
LQSRRSSVVAALNVASRRKRPLGTFGEFEVADLEEAAAPGRDRMLSVSLFSNLVNAIT